MQKKSQLVKFKPAELYEGKEWYVAYYVEHPATGIFMRKRVKLNRIQSLVERRKYAKEIIRELNNKLYNGWNPFILEETPKGFEELQTAMNNFYRLKERELRADSLRSYRSYIDIFTIWLNQKTELKFCVQFTNMHAMEFMEYVYDIKRVSNRTFNNYLTFFLSMFNWLIEAKYVSKNPFSGIRKKKEETKNRILIPVEDRKRIIEYLEHEDYDFMIVCLLVFHTLIRPKEITWLKPSSFNLFNQTIFIHGSFAKNHNDRVATIPDSMMPALDGWNFNTAGSNEFIFGKNFKPGTESVNSRRLDKKWDKMRKALDLPMEMKLYSLRDSGIVQLLQDGISPEEVMKQADHSSLDITTVYVKYANPTGSEQIKKKGSGF